ncbi:hypothetical protein K6U49_10125 [Vibrio alginolyticus]|uniref:hypothetical protein n=1 Tax=Vibrio alginolyticus TaxID=663 RepID=UPI001EEB3AB7|nr:hypothetical protein [Vibrio alginolyticus]MCG6308941.1 hypothetical protein [Vibrio alginolyticus]
MLDKQLVHAFHQSLKNYLPDLKLGQSREVVASFYGFKSSASLIKVGFVLSEYDLDSRQADFYDDEFNQHNETPLLLTNEKNVRHRLRRLSKAVLADARLEEQVLLHIRNNLFLKNCKFYSWNEIEPWMVDSLGEELVEKLSHEGNAAAAYSYAVHHFDGIEIDDNAGPHEDYWYKKYISGEVLEGGALRFAKEYEEKLSVQSEYLSLLKRAAELGSKEAMMQLAENTDDVEVIRELAKQGYYPAIEFAYEVYSDTQYEELLAFSGNTAAILNLMEKYEHSSKESEQYKLIFLNELANLYGYYPTQSIADNDEDYGPVFILYEGISLPKVSKELELKAKAEAQKVFNQHNY